MPSGNAPQYVGATIAANLCSGHRSSCPAFPAINEMTAKFE
jgi:hypothetical protein